MLMNSDSPAPFRHESKSKSEVQIHISRVSSSQVPEVAKLHQDLIYDPSALSLGPQALVRYYGYLAKDPHSAVYVATVDNRVVGFASVVDRQERVLLRFLSHDIFFAVRILPGLMFSSRGIRYILNKIRNDFLGRKWGTYSPEEANRCELRSIAISSSEQGKGLGRGLLGACIQYARSVSMKEMIAWIESTNVASQALFRNLGFCEQGKVDVESPNPWLLFRLNLLESENSSTKV